MTNVPEAPFKGVWHQWSKDVELFRGMVEALTNNATVAFIVCNLQDQVMYVNQTFESVFGWTLEEVFGTRLPTLREQDWPEFHERLLGQQWELKLSETFRLRKDGTLLPVSETVAPIRSQNGDVISYACVIRDITGRKHAERKLKESEQRFKSLFEQNPDAVLSLNLAGRMTDVNPAGQRMMGNRPELLLDGRLEEWIVPEERSAFRHHLEQTKSSGTQHFDSALTDSLGNRVELNMKLLPIYVDEEVVGMYCIAKDITGHKRALETINFLAFHDSLTELPNRRLFHNRLTELLGPDSQPGERVAVVWIDLDGFKQINDTHGHAAGDYVLGEVAGRLRSSVRSQDLVARMGGDEFTVLLRGISELDDVVKLSERLIHVLGEPIRYRQEQLCITPSIGIALHPEDGTDAETLLIRADTAMYQVKQGGKNGFRFYSQAR
ncbi:diguanylate cyclase domain-containing protein [Paenibacillus silviterrae]|uniref:diguanylate cyclase domain-containing protein n=1 Tax=Paenibacillus silviterrae TaxID=3242194 RepID=UPI002543CF3F|nr:diguanylate cyclase [Paenibacillus chinjuensis]